MAISAQGQVARLYPDTVGCYIRLENPANVPKDGYFRLLLDHPNYSALYSMAVVSYVNNLSLYIRTKKDIISTEHAEVSYFILDTDYNR